MSSCLMSCCHVSISRSPSDKRLPFPFVRLHSFLSCTFMADKSPGKRVICTCITMGCGLQSVTISGNTLPGKLIAPNTRSLHRQKDRKAGADGGDEVDGGDKEVSDQSAYRNGREINGVTLSRRRDWSVTGQQTCHFTLVSSFPAVSAPHVGLIGPLMSWYQDREQRVRGKWCLVQ